MWGKIAHEKETCRQLILLKQVPIQKVDQWMLKIHGLLKSDEG